MIKKTSFYVGITLIIQSITMAVLFFFLFSKKKSLAATLLAMSAAGGIAGGVLLYKHAKREEAEKERLAEMLCDELGLTGEEDVEILTDENVDEAEFC